MILHDLDAAMTAMSEALAARGDVSESLSRITRAAVDTLPLTDYASISIRRPDGSLQTTAETGPMALEADRLQYALREGPCYDAVTEDEVTYARDLSRSSTWPQFGPAVAELGLMSQMAFRLANRDGTVTGLNLYSRQPEAFEDDGGMARLFASHARVALGFANQLVSLHGAIGTRETVGKAIGIVMERYGLTSERAFEFLIRVSQTSNTKLRDIAIGVVETTELEQQA